MTQVGPLLLQLQLFSAWLASEGVVVVTGLFTDQENHFSFLFTFGHLGRLYGYVASSYIIAEPEA